MKRADPGSLVTIIVLLVSASFFHSSSQQQPKMNLYIYCMPPKAEYWILTKEQFNDIKTQINELEEKILDDLQGIGFTKIKSSSEWLGLTVEKRQGDLLTFVLFSLSKESPQEFQIVLRRWDIKNPPETCVDLYEKRFSNIEDFVLSYSDELKLIKEKLR